MNSVDFDNVDGLFDESNGYTIIREISNTAIQFATDLHLNPERVFSIMQIYELQRLNNVMRRIEENQNNKTVETDSTDTLFIVFENNRPAVSYPAHNCMFTSFKEAQEYVGWWIGDENDNDVPDEPNKIVTYTAYDDTIEIRSYFRER